MLNFGNKALEQQLEVVEEKLADYEQIFSSLKSEMLHLSLDAAGRVVDANQLFYNEIKLDISSVSGQKFTALVPEKARKTKHYEALCHAIEQQKHWAGAVEIIGQGQDDIQWIRAILQPIKNNKGICTSFDIFANNLTRTISNSQRSESLIDGINRSMAVIEFSTDGIIIEANKLFLNAVGYEKNEIEGKHHRMFCTPEEANSEAYKAFWQKLNHGEYVAGRFRRKGKLGNEVWLEASYNPIFDSHDHLERIVKFAVDITEQVEQEQQVNNAAEIAFDTSKETDLQAEKGSALISDSMQVVNQLMKEMENATVQINELHEQSNSINAMVSAISGIAEQTNLLALNAAIEAARAGDQGRGFAVVADEVRQLASRTTSSTEEIVKVVSNNKNATSNAVEAISHSKDIASKLVTELNSCENVMLNIKSGATRVVEAVSQFANRLNKK